MSIPPNQVPQAPGMQPVPQQPQYHPLGPGAQVAPPMVNYQPGQPPKEAAAFVMCRVGQEIVQEIVAKTMEILQTLKAITLPNNSAVNMQHYQERRAKIEEHSKKMHYLFLRLRMYYVKVNEVCMPLRHESGEPLNLLDEEEDREQILARQTEVYQYACEERKELTEQVRLKNRQLKEIIDQLRTIIWEINTMMAMRHT